MLYNSFMHAFQTVSLQDLRVQRILAGAFDAVEPARAVKRFLQTQTLPKAKRNFIFGLGKAACAMSNALADEIDFADSLIITKRASFLNPKLGAVMLGNHPVPGAESLAAGRAALKFLAQLNPDDLLICLISGGGSALMSAPIIPLEEMQALTETLLTSGARIEEINTLRRHLDLLKGGGVVQAAHGAQIISLILSDVVGDPIEAIASGPTAADPSTREDAAAVAARITNSRYDFRETLKPDDSIFKNVQNIIVGNNDAALNAAKAQAEQEGFYAEIIQRGVQGEARDIAKELVQKLEQACELLARPFCLLAGGETTVTIRGDGKGGRNSELALAAAIEMAGMKNVLCISVATDGEDGITDAAGAVATGESVQRAGALGVEAVDSLLRNDAYSFFDSIGDLIRIGSSGTNVNDLVLMIGL